MITVISSTNRNESNTLLIAKHYTRLLEGEGIEVQLLDLSEMPETIAFSELYGRRTSGFDKIIDRFITDVPKFVFVIPEYNGSFPGFLKLFIDAVPPSAFHGKQAGLVGLSSGHSGALRPMDHFSTILEYIQVDVIHNKPKLSAIETLLDEDGRLTDPRALQALKKHAKKMVSL